MTHCPYCGKPLDTPGCPFNGGSVVTVKGLEYRARFFPSLDPNDGRVAVWDRKTNTTYWVEHVRLPQTMPQDLTALAEKALSR